MTALCSVCGTRMTLDLGTHPACDSAEFGTATRRVLQARSTAAAVEAMGAALAARPAEAARVEAAIRQLAATGRPFSANDAREIHGVRGGVVGATFNSLKSTGVIRACGDETSTDKRTHGHRIFQWIGAVA